MPCRRVLALSSCALALSLAAAPPAAGQTVLAEYQLPGPLGSVGERVGLAGDVDGDGVMDLLAAGEFGVATFAGDDGALLGFQPLVMVDSFDSVLNVAGLDDADGDGQRDLVVCTARSGALAYSRADGALLWQVPGSFGGSLGWRLAVLADLDGDRVGDVAFGEPDADPHGLSSAGSIHVISAATGALIKRIDGSFANQSFGRSMAAFDAGGNAGASELIVGDRAHKVDGLTVGRLLVLAASTGAVLQQVVNGSATTNFAADVADAGDLDGDGLHDLAATGTIGGIVQTRAWSGDDGALLWSRPAPETLNLRSAGDVNGDGTPELVVGAPGFLFLPGTGKLLDGASGVVLAPLSGPTAGSFFSLAVPGDLTGDGLPDLLVGNVAVPNAGLPESSASVLALPAGGVALSLGLPPNGTLLGASGAVAGDFDGDELEDVALAGLRDVAVFSRESGALLAQHAIAPPIGDFGTPVLVAPGDLDGDGTPDFALGDGFQPSGPGQEVGRVLLLSGADGSSLGGGIGQTNFENYGAALAATTDHDGDGVRDVYVGVPGRLVSGAAQAGEGELRSGASFALLASYHGAIQSQGRFGSSLDCGGDLDGDGVPELVVGSREELPGATNAGTLHVLDGATGATLMTVGGATDAWQTLGAIVGDADGDGVPELLAVESQWPQSGANTKRGRIRLLSGATGLLLWEQQGQPGSSLGLRYAAAGDVDGDGRTDVLAARTDATAGALVSLHSGLDGAPLDTIDVPATGTVSGVLLPLGRFDSGACDDVLIGTLGLGGNGGAHVWASSDGGAHGYTDLGFAKPTATGALPGLSAFGDLGPGQLVSYRARRAPPLKFGTWFVGLSAGYAPFKQGILVPDPFGPLLLVFVNSDAAGEFALDATTPNAALAGLSIVHQIWFHEPSVPGGRAATNGLQQTFK